MTLQSSSPASTVPGLKSKTVLPGCFDRIIWEAAFSELGEALKANRQTLDESRRTTACDFSVFDFIAPSENVLSDILASLLDPEGKHGQSDRFLRSLLAKVAPKRVTESGDLVVVREALTYTNPKNPRRIDIVATFHGFTLAIETKKYAKEQKNQIADYCDHLERIAGANFCLIFLTRAGEMPESIPRERADALIKAGQLVLLSWKPGVSAWLEASMQDCPAPKIRHFLEDFQTYIDAYLEAQQAEDTYAEEPAR